jgi:ABC-type lipoprotein export system ATPase subunit/GNAT superfamily N-acetyltransferase
MATAHRERRVMKNHSPFAVQVRSVRTTSRVRNSVRAAETALGFGLPFHPQATTILEPFEVTLSPGRIILITGPSGGGKSTALAQIERQLPGACDSRRMRFTPQMSIIENVAPSEPITEAMRLLTGCGLGEPRLWLRAFDELSDGEKFRARLARAVGLHVRDAAPAPLICDEFCSGLHRRAARAVSFNLRKLVTREGLCAVLACANDDIVSDLQPDVVVRLDGRGGSTVEQRKPRPGRPFSLRRRLRITRGTKRDYGTFAAMHYRAADELGFVTKVFLLREGFDGEILGIAVYAHPPLELSLRNRATHDRFLRNPRMLNRKVRILRRLVVHPDVRGCGLGHYLVRRTLPLVGTDYVECLAAMGAFNPVFEKAGMIRVGRYEVPAARRRALRLLEDLGVDPMRRDFPWHVGRCPRVREIVSRVVYEWYAATTGEGRGRVARQSFETLARTFRGIIASRPVYYLWNRRAKRSRSPLVTNMPRSRRRAMPPAGSRNRESLSKRAYLIEPSSTDNRPSIVDIRRSTTVPRSTAPPTPQPPATRPHAPRPSEVVSRETDRSPAIGPLSAPSDGCHFPVVESFCHDQTQRVLRRST